MNKLSAIVAAACLAIPAAALAQVAATTTTITTPPASVDAGAGAATTTTVTTPAIGGAAATTTTTTATNTSWELKDGTKVEVAPDTTVWVVNADGSKTPAPDGAHTLKDGSTLNTKDGKKAAE